MINTSKKPRQRVSNFVGVQSGIKGQIIFSVKKGANNLLQLYLFNIYNHLLRVYISSFVWPSFTSHRKPKRFVTAYDVQHFNTILFDIPLMLCLFLRNQLMLAKLLAYKSHFHRKLHLLYFITTSKFNAVNIFIFLSVNTYSAQHAVGNCTWPYGTR